MMEEGILGNYEPKEQYNSIFKSIKMKFEAKLYHRKEDRNT